MKNLYVIEGTSNSGKTTTTRILNEIPNVEIIEEFMKHPLSPKPSKNIEEELKKQGIYPNKIEGYNSNGWILLDYGEVVVHIFTEQERIHYNLDDLWKINK